MKRGDGSLKRVETLDQKVELDYSARSEKTAVERMLIEMILGMLYCARAPTMVLSER